MPKAAAKKELIFSTKPKKAESDFGKGTQKPRANASERQERQRSDQISKDTTLGEVVEKYPKAAEVFMKYGLHCIGCHVSEYETVEQGAAMHGITGAKFAKMMKELNGAAKRK